LHHLTPKPKTTPANHRKRKIKMAVSLEQVQKAKASFESLKQEYDLQQDVRVTKQLAEEKTALETNPAHYYTTYIFQIPNGFAGRVVFKADRKTRRRVFEAANPNISKLRNELRQHGEQGVTPEDTRA
jgi:hypothetical protein